MNQMDDMMSMSFESRGNDLTQELRGQMSQFNQQNIWKLYTTLIPLNVE